MTPQGTCSLPEASGIKGRQLQQAQVLHEAVPMSTSRCARPLNFATCGGAHARAAGPDGGNRNSVVAPGVIGARAVLRWAWHHDTTAARRHGQGPVREHCRPLPSPDRSTTTAGKERRDGPTRLTGEPMYHGVKSCQHGLPNQQNHLSNTTQGLFARFHKV